jgi:phosphoribosyl 1,2-cyclic phosphodiesterase
MHTATLVVYRRRRLLIDCGESWLGRVAAIRPHAILVTHAHPDHAFGLREGAPCPVYATAASWETIKGFPIPPDRRRRVHPRRPFEPAGIRVEAFPVVHSVRAPAVGYRVTAGRVSIFYVPDVVDIPTRAEALAGIRAYVGDGATLARSMVRRDGATGTPIGHTPVRTQLAWCAEQGVPLMVVTHCGSGIVAGDGRRVAARLRTWARAAGVQARIARDGMELVLR